MFIFWLVVFFVKILCTVKFLKEYERVKESHCRGETILWAEANFKKCHEGIRGCGDRISVVT